MRRGEDSEWYDTASRVAILLMILMVIAVLAWGWFGGLELLNADTSSSAYFPRAEEGRVQLRVDDRRYLATDDDRNGEVDCLLPVGSASLTGMGVYHAPDADCARFGPGRRVLDPELRSALSALARAKLEQKATFTTVLDVDGDGGPDCVVSVFDGVTVFLRAAGASCPRDGGATFTDAQRVAFGEILALEERIRARIRDGS